MFNDSNKIAVLEGNLRKMLQVIDALAARIEALDNRIELLGSWVKEVSDSTLGNNEKIVTILRDNAEMSEMSAESSEKLSESLLQDALAAALMTVNIAKCEGNLKVLTGRLEELSVRLESVEIKTA